MLQQWAGALIGPKMPNVSTDLRNAPAVACANGLPQGQTLTIP
jgi:hypothetical protein